MNLDRAARGRPLDPAYAAKLSADALPAFRRVLPVLGTNEACTAAYALERRWHEELATRERWTTALARTPREAASCGAGRGG